MDYVFDEMVKANGRILMPPFPSPFKFIRNKVLEKWIKN